MQNYVEVLSEAIKSYRLINGNWLTHKHTRLSKYALLNLQSDSRKIGFSNYNVDNQASQTEVCSLWSIGNVNILVSLYQMSTVAKQSHCDKDSKVRTIFILLTWGADNSSIIRKWTVINSIRVVHHTMKAAQKRGLGSVTFHIIEEHGARSFVKGSWVGTDTCHKRNSSMRVSIATLCQSHTDLITFNMRNMLSVCLWEP